MNDKEKQLVYTLAQKLTGAHPEGTFQHGIFITNVERRMRECKLETLEEYLSLVDDNPQERSHLISALSIHTTSWFRENPHYVILQKILMDHLNKNEPFRIWCAAASTGEEVYSFALMLEEFRKFHKSFEYSILGTDIDPISLTHAKKAIYPKKALSGPVSYYQDHILYGSGRTENYFTFTPELRRRCEFMPHDIREPLNTATQFDLIACRNVLIYFTQPIIHKVMRLLTDKLKTDGHLILGHSEMIQHTSLGLELREHSVYQKNKKTPPPESKPVSPARNVSAPTDTKNILVVDDSSLAREAISKQLVNFGFRIQQADSVENAELRLMETKFDLITLDINMPGIPGDDWLRILRRRGEKIPIIIISDVNTQRANHVVRLLEEGSLAYIEKRELREQPEALPQTIIHILENRTQSSVQSGTEPKKMPDPTFAPPVILIGASTGGPSVLMDVLPGLPPHTPPLILVQHINPKFAASFAERIAEVSGLSLGPMKDGEPLRSGHIYAATDDYHLAIDVTGEQNCLRIQKTELVNNHRPSVDHLFLSATALPQPPCAILLTGMGKDGAHGLDALHKQGAYTMAQSEKDCVVFGMPKEAIRRNAADFVGTGKEIHDVLYRIIQNTKK